MCRPAGSVEHRPGAWRVCGQASGKDHYSGGFPSQCLSLIPQSCEARWCPLLIPQPFPNPEAGEIGGALPALLVNEPDPTRNDRSGDPISCLQLGFNTQEPTVARFLLNVKVLCAYLKLGTFGLPELARCVLSVRSHLALSGFGPSVAQEFYLL